MAAGRIIIPNCMPALDINGNPVSGAKLTFYVNETTTLLPVYTTSALSVAHPNPISADAAGAFASIFADTTVAYSVAITDADNAPIVGLRNRDNVKASLFFGDDVVTEAEAAAAAAAASAATALAGGTPTLALRSTMAAIASPSGAVIINEKGREGTFYWYTAAGYNTATGRTLTADVGNDTLQGVLVAKSTDATGASGAWFRKDAVLYPEMWGAADSGSVNDIAALRNAGYWACQLKRPLAAGPGRYYLTTVWRVGSASSSAPASGAADYLEMPGAWRFICDAPAEDALVQFEDCTNVMFGDADFDIVTATPSDGHGAIRLVDVNGFSCGSLRKVGTEIVAATYSASGGSVLSINNGSRDIVFRSAIVEWAGELASAVFAVDAYNIQGGYARCIGGQDGVDISAVDGFSFTEIYAEDLDPTSKLEGSILDCGNSSNGWVGKLHGLDVPIGVTFKTEASGGIDTGSNNVRIESLHCDDFYQHMVQMSGGATIYQTLHNLTLGRVTGTTTVADADTSAFYIVAGDDTADPTSGFEVDSADIVMNAGAAVNFVNGAIKFRFSNFRCNAPLGVIDGTPSAFTTPNKGQWENCEFSGPFATGADQTTFRNIKVGGTFSAAEGYGNRYVNCDARVFDMNFNSAVKTEKDVVVNGLVVKNSDGRALRLRHLGADSAMTGVLLQNVVMVDDQQSLSYTSGGTTELAVGNVVTGATSGAVGTVTKITLTSGTWAAGTAAGKIWLTAITGTFAAENLNITGFANIATSSGATALDPTSTGFAVDSSTTDYCTINVMTARGLADNQTWGFTGLNSRNINVNLRDPSESLFGGTTVTMLHAGRRIVHSGAGTITAPPDATTAFPISTVIEIEDQNGGGSVVAAGAGVTVRSLGADLTLGGLNAVARLKKIAANTWSLEGQL